MNTNQEAKENRNSYIIPIGNPYADDCGLYVSAWSFTKEAGYEADRVTVPAHPLNLGTFVHHYVKAHNKTDDETRSAASLARIWQAAQQFQNMNHRRMWCKVSGDVIYTFLPSRGRMSLHFLLRGRMSEVSIFVDGSGGQGGDLQYNEASWPKTPTSSWQGRLFPLHLGVLRS